MKIQPTTERTCARCGRPVGILSTGFARSYVYEVTDQGVSVVCHNNPLCKIIRMNRKGEK